MGMNVDWAPVVDLCTTPESPAVGTRSFGEDPAAVGRPAAAFTTGMQSTGVAAAAKHYPGSGDTVVDPHHGLPMVTHDLAHLRAASCCRSGLPSRRASGW